MGVVWQVKQVSAAPGTIFEAAEQCGDWMRVLMGEEASAWMSASAQGMSLLRPARREQYIMDPAVRNKEAPPLSINLPRNGPSNDQQLFANDHL